GVTPIGTGDDFGGADAFCTSSSPDRLSEAEQRQVGLAYTAAFFRFYIGQEAEFGPLLRGDDPPPSEVDQNVFVGYHPPAFRRLDLNRLDQASDFTTGITRCGFDHENPCFSGASREAHWSTIDFNAFGESQITT